MWYSWVLKNNQTDQGMSRRGGARPGAGRKPGQVGQAKRALAERAAEHSDAALSVLAEIMQDRKTAPSARIAAATAILDRAHGRPTTLAPEPQEDRLAQAIREISQRGPAMPIGGGGGC